MKSYSTQTNERKTDVTVMDVVKSKQDAIHSQMYEEALAQYVSYAGIIEDDYRFIELRASYWDEPSSVQVITKRYPYSRQTVSLSPWWNDYKFDGRMDLLEIDNDNTVNTAEVVYRDYVRGYAELRSRYTGRTFKVALKDVPEDVKEIEDEKSMQHTFSYKVQHKVYGQDNYGEEVKNG